MRLLPFAMSLSLAAVTCVAGAAATPEEREPAVLAFVEAMVQKHGFDRDSLTARMHRARFRGDILAAMSRPAEAKPWHRYRPIFVTDARARAGVGFWREHEALLTRAEREYGVPAEIIVAIIGVETRYGSYTGRHRVLDALTTLAFGYPRRAEFFRGQLEDFLLLEREEPVVGEEVTGSYAGAMGLPQFIPSSYRKYAVDFDGDGQRDLWGSKADVIGSVANYFRAHGWRRGEPVAVPARSGDADLQPLLDAGMQPSLTARDLAAHGIQVSGLPADARVSLVRLELARGEEYWVGLNNFYVITRYNRSNLYAMAVYQLSRDIRDLRIATQGELVRR
jgi:membrane-bound lytic murein transglycosylase B